MGTIQHTAVIFTEQDDVKPICEFYVAVLQREKQILAEHEHTLLTPLMVGYNCFRSFAIMPHGSSLGKTRAEEVAEFTTWARQLAASMRIESVLVSWGECGTRVDDQDEDAVIDAAVVSSQKELTP